jgi:hypothetical protein
MITCLFIKALTICYYCLEVVRIEITHTLGETIKEELVALITNIYRSNCRVEKKLLLSNARENLEVVRLLMRLANNLKQFTLNDFVKANMLVESISKQLVAWENIV